ncbi:hypothetical protein SAMN00808754_0823 [Thermanaeromonas toyohensis ToBE]|uniref:Outer membrane protein assembly factor BamB, contains PQQ-like beta-propeller repeat n=1 Tax=Thermanaeromonas toyohensis ToBE TaxID=698762 RepID=A0A1W1VIX8_9FIRM|nr:hypothetical protein [Thermanaeromonas toyohensis]SMB93233.1 hypothetical protein SAMN00808754_0823 [Thermanaeromonas toyohensis ToBE]
MLGINNKKKAQWLLLGALLFLLIVERMFGPGRAKATPSYAPVLEWSHTLGIGEARCVVQTKDGGYVLTGWTNSGQEGSEVFLVRCNEKGNILWSKTFKGNGHSCGYSVKEVREGGFIIVGDTKSKDGYDHDVYVVRTDEKGEPLWERNFGGQYCDYAWSVQQTRDGGFIFAGGTESFGAGLYDIYLIKLDAAGNKLWERTYGGKGSDCGYAVQELDDGGYLIAGNSESFSAGYPDVYLIKTDVNGQIIWQKTYGGQGSDYGWSLTLTSDGGYVIAGEKEIVSDQGNILAAYLFKVDPEGKVLWEKTYGNKTSSFYAISPVKGGGYVLTGKKETAQGGYAVYVVRTNKSGDPVWETTIEGLGYNCGYSILQSRDRGYVLVGRKERKREGGSEILLTKFGLAP